MLGWATCTRSLYSNDYCQQSPIGWSVVGNTSELWCYDCLIQKMPATSMTQEIQTANYFNTVLMLQDHMQEVHKFSLNHMKYVHCAWK